MAVLTHLETDTGTNVDISGATAVGAYTANADKLIMVDVSIDAVAGNGDYVMYVTRQIGGSGSAYRILPQTTMAAASGLTAISAQSGWITVRNGDVLTCYVDGLAGDTSTPDWSTRWFELAGVTAAAVADAVWDEATADHTAASSFGALDANVDAILADTGTDGVKIASAQTVATVTNLTNLPTMPTDWVTAAGLKADAVTEIQSGLATAAALAAIQADLDNPDQYKADVSGLATSAEVGAITMLDEVVVGSYTMQDILKILAAKMVGKATGGGTATITYRGLDDTSDVIIETVDSNGNRSAVTLTV